MEYADFQVNRVFSLIINAFMHYEFRYGYDKYIVSHVDLVVVVCQNQLSMCCGLVLKLCKYGREF